MITGEGKPIPRGPEARGGVACRPGGAEGWVKACRGQAPRPPAPTGGLPSVFRSPVSRPRSVHLQLHFTVDEKTQTAAPSFQREAKVTLKCFFAGTDVMSFRGHPGVSGP